ncbi:MAG: SUMF1/EgtB/PvdO family nonheme iron enzyme [Nitrospirae bacterium]|nr:SUMF1/EgtB/PvdO family nonheme iron enzyme [Nitrospirota bacterium]
MSKITAVSKGLLFVLLLIIAASVLPGTAMAMPAPTGQAFFQYEAVATPVVSDDAGQAKPIGGGSVVDGGDILALLINAGQFSAPVDLYLGAYLPAVDSQNIYLLTESGVQTLTQGLVPWKRGVTSANQTVFDQISVSTLPRGPYTFYLVVTPTGSLNSYTLYATQIQIADVKVTVGSDGGTVVVPAGAGGIVDTSVTIPPGVLLSNKMVSIGGMSNCPSFPSTTGSTNCIDFGPSGTNFELPATVTIPYDPATVEDAGNLLVYNYDEASSAWVAAKTINVDTVKHLVTAQVSHFSQYTAQDQKAKAAVNLHQHSQSNELSASIVITTPFKDMATIPSLSSCTGATNMADLLFDDAADFTFSYVAKLKKYNGCCWPDSTVAMKTVSYTQMSTNCKVAHCGVTVSDGSTTWFSSGSMTYEGYFDWYTGAPALIRFGVEPENDKKYYVVLDLEVIGKYCTLKGSYNFDGQSQRTSSFLPQKNVDTDEDGITNGYDKKTPDISVPSQITGLTLTPVSSTQIDLSWNRSSDNVAVTGYRVYRQTGSFAGQTLDPAFLKKIITTDTPSWSNTGLSASTTYCYRVAATDAAQNVSTYAEDCASTPATPDTTAPSTPTGLSASANSRTQLDLSWTASTDKVGVSGYKLYRAGNFIKSANSTSITDYDLQAGTEYCYEVTAYDAAGNESLKSSQVCKKTLSEPDTTLPSVPTGLSATSLSEHQITLSWGASTDNVSVTGYRVYNSGSLIQTVTGISTSVTGLSPGTGYCYAVAAVDPSNNVSARSSEVCETTQVVVDTQAPTVPVGLSATVVSPYQIDISWNPSSDNVGVAGYKVFRNGPEALSIIGSWISDTGLNPATQYCYQIAAFDAAGNNSGKGAQLCSTTQAATEMAVPVGKHWYTYTGIQLPVTNVDPSLAAPLGFGADPATLRALIETTGFTGAVDAYIVYGMKQGWTEPLFLMPGAGVCGCGWIDNNDASIEAAVLCAVHAGSCVFQGNTTGPLSVNQWLDNPEPGGAKYYLVITPYLTERQRFYLSSLQDYYIWEVVYQGVDPANIDDDVDGVTENQGDCNDGSNTIFPGATEICGDGIDQNCDGVDLACAPDPNDTDNDGDGFTESQGDCNDGSNTIFPGATEICGDGIDQDCSGADLLCGPPPPSGGMGAVPGGCFQMGDIFGVGSGDELPVHQVCLSSFSIDRYEVTQSEYQAVTGTNPSYFTSCGGNCPVEQVSWTQADAYCRAVGKRLPTEAEWEYAARSGGQNQKYAGTSSDAELGNYAWYWENSGCETNSVNCTSRPVGQKLPNGLGLYDMSGNVWEWVADWYDVYPSSAQNNPQGPSTESTRGIRGGCWGNDPGYLRASLRGRGSPDNWNDDLGFRCARTP